MVVNYPYSESEINSWIKTINRLFPYVTPETIGKITDDFLKGEIEFIKDYGILNYTKRIPNYSGKLR